MPLGLVNGLKLTTVSQELKDVGTRPDARRLKRQAKDQSGGRLKLTAVSQELKDVGAGQTPAIHYSSLRIYNYYKAYSDSFFK